MRDFVLDADDIKDQVYKLNEEEGAVIFDELQLESYYRKNLRKSPRDPFVVLFKAANKAPRDPFGVVPHMNPSYWSEVCGETVLIVLASRNQLVRVRDSIDKTIVPSRRQSKGTFCWNN